MFFLPFACNRQWNMVQGVLSFFMEDILFTPTLLLILDGWGVAPPGPGNAVSLANTPYLDSLFPRWPHTTLHCSGRDVGLPAGFMGNSEVGHMNIGAGRIVYQDMTRIDMAIEKKELQRNPVLTALLSAVEKSGRALHFMGLLSDSGVHSHIDHLFALLEVTKKYNVSVFIHAFTDGRDAPPTSGVTYMEKLVAGLQKFDHAKVATISGRYYAMDRDSHFERNRLVYDAFTLGQGRHVPDDDPVGAIADAYSRGETDEFIRPLVLTRGKDPVATLSSEDGVLFFNFRADRARQLVQCLFDPGFTAFDRQVFPNLHISTMTSYDATFPLPALFAPVEIKKPLGEVVADAGLMQLRIAETEKYAHVTYFMNCGREEPLKGEERVLVPSPRTVPTYDKKPEMSAFTVTEKLLQAMAYEKFGFIVCNLANMDMVGHTGGIPAAIQAVEAVDKCLKSIIPFALDKSFRIMLTADHGNAEELLNEKGELQTAHTMNPVYFFCLEKGRENRVLRFGGRLGDIAPTILDLWGMEKPGVMTGTTLVEK